MNPLSPTIFTTFIAGIDKEFMERVAGGVVVGIEKFWTLSYAESEMN